MRKAIITSHRPARLVIPLLVVFLHASGIVLADDAIEHDNSTQSKTVYFPQFQLFQTVKNETDMLYEITGKLILKDECLRVASGRNEYLLVWPGWYEFGVTGREIAVTHLRTGSVVAGIKIGDTVSFSGAELENHPINLQYAIPDQCPGPYWAVGEIESVKTGNPIKSFSDKANKKRFKSAKRLNTLIKNNPSEKIDKETKHPNKELINLEKEIEDSILR